MIFRRNATILALALSLAACGKKADAPAAPSAPIAAVAPPAGTEWTDTYQATPEGGMRMGNPDAPVKLVEYASLTCPHCRDFTAEAGEPLRATYVKSGKVSWEYRPFLLNSLDVPAFLLARCQGPAPFFKLADQLYAAQTDWVGKAARLTPAEQARIQALAPADQFKTWARDTGLDGFFRVRGLPQAKADQCLSDQAAADRLVAIRDKATNDEAVQGTPSFFINGRLQTGQPTWAVLDEALKGALGG